MIRLGRPVRWTRADLAMTAMVILTCWLAGLAGAGCRKRTSPSDRRHSPQIMQTKLGAEMVVLPGGWFQMGSTGGQANERPRRKVWVSSFAIDRTEVTQQQFRSLEISDPSHFKGADRPVEQVTMSEVIDFCNERSYTEGLQEAYIVSENRSTWRCDFTADGYRLPTEAEWEYACRAGSTSPRYVPDRDGRLLASCAWYKGNSSGKTHPVAGKKPNEWGLYDMYGNVSEWCNDYYQEDYYGRGPNRDPRGPGAAKLAVVRGGSWNSPVEHCRSAWRAGESPSLHDICFARDTIGFRCVRSAPAK